MKGPRERVVELIRIGHVFPMTAKADHSQIVTCVAELTANQPFWTIIPQLDLMLCIPAPIISDDDNEGEFLPHGCFEFGELKADGSITH